MMQAFTASARKRFLGTSFLLLGIFLWLLIVIVPHVPLHIWPSLGYVEKRSLAVTLGGASVAGGIIVLLAPRRSRRRYRR